MKWAMRWVLVLSLGPSAWACHLVEGEHISGKDLAAASEVFVGLDPDLEIAPTPLPGVPRLFHAVELARLGQIHGIAVPAPEPEICFERVTEPLTAERLLPVLRSALAIDAAQIVIEDFSRAGVPRGKMEFTRNGLSAAGLWRGQVIYAEARSVPVWARVRVTVERKWVEAIDTLPAGRAIAPGQLVERRGPRFPFAPVALDSIALAAGREPTRVIKSGEPIFGSVLIAPREVERGDRVSVVVMSGETRIELQAEAETAGRLGELVMVRNPDSGRPFQARVDGKDKVLIKK
jgi:flagella basal body P-ring formation protein FlgA